MGSNSRIAWIDAWKGLLILLVVLGHVAGGMYHYAGEPARTVVRLIYKSIYLFHIPAFFFFSGWVQANRKSKERFIDFFCSRSRRLLIPYVFFGVGSALVFWGLLPILPILGNGSDAYYSSEYMYKFKWWQPIASLLYGSSWPDGLGFRFNSVLWFLPAMFSVQMIDRALIKFRRFDYLSLILCAIIGGVMRICVKTTLPWGLNIACVMLFYFVLGRILSQLSVSEYVPDWVALLLGWGGLIVLAWTWPHIHYREEFWGWYFYSLFTGSFGSVLSLWTVKRLANGLWRPAWAFVVSCGVLSIGIMLLHKFFVVFAQFIFAPISRLGFAVICLFILGVSFVSAVASLFLSKILCKFAPWILGEVSSSGKFESKVGID